jgi:hypothetical protein
MENDNNSLDKMSEILKKVQALLKENGAYFDKSILSTDDDVDNMPYNAEITIHLR